MEHEILRGHAGSIAFAAGRLPVSSARSITCIHGHERRPSPLKFHAALRP